MPCNLIICVEWLMSCTSAKGAFLQHLLSLECPGIVWIGGFGRCTESLSLLPLSADDCTFFQPLAKLIPLKGKLVNVYSSSDHKQGHGSGAVTSQEHNTTLGKDSASWLQQCSGTQLPCLCMQVTSSAGGPLSPCSHVLSHVKNNFNLKYVDVILSDRL